MNTHLGSRHRAFTLIEVLIYVVMIAAFIVISGSVYQRATRQSLELHLQADTIRRVMHAGERWRVDIRAAARAPEWAWVDRNGTEGNVMRLTLSDGASVEYFMNERTVWRRHNQSEPERLLGTVRASAMVFAGRGGVRSAHGARRAP